MTPYRKLHVSKLKRAKEAASEAENARLYRIATCPHDWVAHSRICQRCGLSIGEWELQRRDRQRLLSWLAP